MGTHIVLFCMHSHEDINCNSHAHEAVNSSKYWFSRSGLFVVDKVSNWPTVEARQVGKSFSSQSCSPRIVSSPHCRPTIRPCRVVYKVPCRKSSSAVQVGWLSAQKPLYRLCFMRHVGLFYSTLASTGDGTQVSSGRRNRLVNILFMTFVNITPFW